MMGEFLRDSSNYKRPPDIGMGKKYYAIVWCPDCNGVDFDGCFDGGVERLGPFESPVEANEAGAELASQSIWKYEIEEVEDEPGTGAH
jgi:hypothetical protein